MRIRILILNGIETKNSVTIIEKEMAATITLAGVLGLTTLFYGLPRLSNTTFVQSSVDNNFYHVMNAPSRQNAADILARLRKKIEILKENVENDEKINAYIRGKMVTLDLSQIQENTMDSEFAAYSINKGERLHFCVRDNKKGGEIKDDPNTLMFVAIHELAHVITKSIGHTEEFWVNQKMLLEKALELGLYIKRDYTVAPIKYCGQIIQSSLSANQNKIKNKN